MTTKRCIRRVLLVILMGFLFCAPVALAAEKPADLAPEDALFFVQVDNVDQLVEKFKKTSTWGLYKEEALQPFINQAIDGIKKSFDEEKNFWKEIGLNEAPEQIPWPQGKIIVVGFIQPRSFKWDDQVEIQEPDFQIVGLVDFGKNGDIARKVSSDIVKKAIEEEKLVKEAETIRDVQITILKENADSDADYDTFCYGFVGNQMIVGSSLKYIRKTLMLIDGVDMPRLSENESYISMNQALGESDFSAFVNIKRLLEVLRGTLKDDELNDFNRYMTMFGINTIDGLGIAMALAPEKNVQAKTKILLRIKGEKKGIPAILVPESVSLRPGRMLEKGLASFMVANYDFGKLYDGITKLIWSATGMNPDPMIQGAMMATADPQGGNAVNLREELIGQLDKPVTVGVDFDKPYTDSGSMKIFMSIGVKDGQILNKALARIHNTFLARGQKEMQRELNGNTLYLMPNPFAMMMGFRPGMTPNTQSFLALAVVGDQLVFSSDKIVEQAIRDLRRSDIATIATDPMYQYADDFLPESAGIYFYENVQVSTEKDWVSLKEAAKKVAAETPEESRQITMPLMAFGTSAMLEPLVRELKGVVDFTLLPDFDAVKKYFGPTVSHISNRDDGIYLEVTNLNSPGQ